MYLHKNDYINFNIIEYEVDLYGLLEVKYYLNKQNIINFIEVTNGDIYYPELLEYEELQDEYLENFEINFDLNYDHIEYWKLIKKRRPEIFNSLIELLNNSSNSIFDRFKTLSYNIWIEDELKYIIKNGYILKLKDILVCVKTLNNITFIKLLNMYTEYNKKKK